VQVRAGTIARVDRPAFDREEFGPGDACGRGGRRRRRIGAWRPEHGGPVRGGLDVVDADGQPARARTQPGSCVARASRTPAEVPVPPWTSGGAVDFATLTPGVHAFSTPDAARSRGKRYYAYLVASERGNVLVHPPDHPAFYRRCAARLDALGVVAWVFLTHAGDARPGCREAFRRFAPRMLVHRDEHASAMHRLGMEPAAATFARARRWRGDVDLLPLPGHGAGSAALLVTRDDHRLAFSGHLLLPGPRGWLAATSPGRLAETRRSLVRLRDAGADRLMPEYAWGDAGTAACAPIRFDATVRAAAIDSALAYLAGLERAAAKGRGRLASPGRHAGRHAAEAG
jgi:hypothetical protein